MKQILELQLVVGELLLEVLGRSFGGPLLLQATRAKNQPNQLVLPLLDDANALAVP